MDAYEVGFWDASKDWNTTYITSDFDQAMAYCSYLNGGLPPYGYTMNVIGAPNA